MPSYLCGMGMGMKSLIAATCIAVLGAIGYLAWGEYGRAQASAQEADFQRHRGVCLDLLKQYVDKPIGGPVTKDQLLTCSGAGYIDTEDINAARR